MHRIVVHRCDSDCPFRHGHRCQHPHVPTHEPLPKQCPIPTWCPLEKHDAVVTRSKDKRHKRSSPATKPRLAMPPAAQRIVRLVAFYTGVTEESIMSGDKSNQTVAARNIALWFIRAGVQSASYPDIGRWFGRDHTTILAAVRRCEIDRLERPPIRDAMAAITNALEGGDDPERCPACDTPILPGVRACTRCAWPDIVPIELDEDRPDPKAPAASAREGARR